jgi:hypothetical protein
MLGAVRGRLRFRWPSRPVLAVGRTVGLLVGAVVRAGATASRSVHAPRCRAACLPARIGKLRRCLRLHAPLPHRPGLPSLALATSQLTAATALLAVTAPITARQPVTLTPAVTLSVLVLGCWAPGPTTGNRKVGGSIPSPPLHFRRSGAVFCSDRSGPPVRSTPPLMLV